MGFDLGNTFSSALQGAALGSPFGVMGNTVGAAFGGLSGAANPFADPSKSNNSTDMTSWLQLADAGNNEQLAGQNIGSFFSQLQGLVDQGPGTAAVQQGLQANQGYGNALQSALQNGGMPTDGDYSNAQSIASRLFAPQQQALELQARGLREGQARTAAQLGRNPLDFALSNKLNQQLFDMNGALQAQQGATAQQLALQMPQQRLDLAGQLAQVRSGLATQAMQNRQAILGLGSSIQQADRQFRLNSGVQRQAGYGQATEHKTFTDQLAAVAGIGATGAKSYAMVNGTYKGV